MNEEEILNLIRTNPEAAISLIEELEAKKMKLKAKKEKLEAENRILKAEQETLDAENRTLFIRKEILEAMNGKLDPISIELRKRILR